MIFFLRRSTGAIKIGTTTRLSVRKAQLEAQSPSGKPLEVLGILDGSYTEEHALHVKFGHLWAGNEWFRADPDLLEFIEREARPWTEEDDDPAARKPMVVQVRGSEDWKSWAEKLAKFDNRAMASLVERAMVRYAKEIGFPDEAPER